MHNHERKADDQADTKQTRFTQSQEAIQWTSR